MFLHSHQTITIEKVGNYCKSKFRNQLERKRKTEAKAGEQKRRKVHVVEETEEIQDDSQ